MAERNKKLDRAAVIDIFLSVASSVTLASKYNVQPSTIENIRYQRIDAYRDITRYLVAPPRVRGRGGKSIRVGPVDPLLQITFIRRIDLQDNEKGES
jgi:hypothetical protein